MRSKYQAKNLKTLTIPSKSNQILNLIFFVFLIFALRITQLCVFKHEEKVKEAFAPQLKTFFKPANRGGIYDRFGIPMAVNKIQYRAGIFYGPLRQIPSIRTMKSRGKKRYKSYPRREYIEKLSKKLSEILHISADRIEDLIHAKASILFEAPYILKEDLTQEQYHQLKILEGDWPGVYAGIEPVREYPLGKVGSHILGYMGSIDKEGYESYLQEKISLERFLNDWQMGFFPPLPQKIKSVSEVRNRLKELKERNYSIYDLVGKSGLEAKFDESLKGYQGKQFFFSDAKGHYLKPLSAHQKSLTGNKLTLTISAELQKHAEELLIENERVRRSLYLNPVSGALSYKKEPWIKGGAIVAIDPKNGEVLALASYPRFDPNDFIGCGSEEERQRKKRNIPKWLETTSFIGDIWNGSAHLSKEIYDPYLKKVVEEEFPLSWDFYLSLILPLDSPVLEGFEKVKDLWGAIEVQKAFKGLLQVCEGAKPFHLLQVLYDSSDHIPYPKSETPSRFIKSIKASLSQYPNEVLFYRRILDHYLSSIHQNYDKMLLIDLCQLIINFENLPKDFQARLKNFSLSKHRELESAHFQIKHVVKNISQELFTHHHFTNWREKNQKTFLKEKRRGERLNHTYAKPYIDYLDKEEKAQFEDFWDKYGKLLVFTFLTGQDNESFSKELKPYYQTLKLWAKEFQQGAHKHIYWAENYKKLTALLDQFDAQEFQTYLTTLREFSDLNRPLYGRYHKVHQKKACERDLAKSFYPKNGFGFSRSYAYRQATPQGSLFKLVTAYQGLMEIYEKKHSEKPELLNPLNMVDDLHPDAHKKGVWNVGFTSQGKPIAINYKGGRLPRSHKRGIGPIDLKGALAVSSNCYFGILAEDIIKNPNKINAAAKNFSFGSKTGIELPGEISGKLPSDLNSNKSGLYSYVIGQHTLVVTPLQTAVMLSSIANGGRVYKPQIIKSSSGLDLRKSNFLTEQNSFEFKDTLSCLGINYPLFSHKVREENSALVNRDVLEFREMNMPKPVCKYLLESMHAVVHGKLSSANPNRVRNFSPSHKNYQTYQKLKDQIIGKTSTAEIREIIDLDLKKGVGTYKHVWFGGIVYEKDSLRSEFSNPELIVVVYLRYGDFGREAAPLVANLAEKWREIKAKEAKKHQAEEAFGKLEKSP